MSSISVWFHTETSRAEKEKKFQYAIDVIDLMHNDVTRGDARWKFWSWFSSQKTLFVLKVFCVITNIRGDIPVPPPGQSLGGLLL
jgi:hypothetical protein